MAATSIGGIVPNALLAARDTLAAKKAPREKTQAEQQLAAILDDLRSTRENAARNAARRKIEQIRIKLEALKLAAGSAAATGDARLARKVARDIRDAARDLGRALNAAGEKGASGVMLPAEKPPGEKLGGEKPTGVAPRAGVRPGDDLAALRGEAAELAKDLRKIMRRLRVTARHPHLERRDRAEMERMFAAAEREIAGLQAATAPRTGMAVDVRA